MNRWRILVVDDNETIAQQTADLLRSEPVSASGDMADVESETSFDNALLRLEQGQYDLLVLDVRDQSRTDDPPEIREDTGSEVTDADVGLQVFTQVRSRRFVPIVFFTALPNLVEGMLRPPFIALVSKHADNDIDELRQSVRDVFDSTLPAINRALLDHVEEIIREFMTEFIEQHWDELRSPSRRGDLTHLLLRRLALSLVDGGEVLSGRLAGEPGVELTPDTVHPMRFYIVPPVGSWTTGDLITGPQILPTPAGNAGVEPPPASGDDDVSDTEQVLPRQQTECWYVVLTPTCDLVPTRVKADYVVLAECVPLAETDEFNAWTDVRPTGDTNLSDAERKAEAGLRRLMLNNAHGRPKDRHVYLPAAWSVPHLLVDFQRIVHLPYGDVTMYTRLATLDSPYAESLVAQFGRYLGRLGTPVLDVDIPLNRLRHG